MGSTDRSGRYSKDKAKLFILSPYAKSCQGRHICAWTDLPDVGGRLARFALAAPPPLAALCEVHAGEGIAGLGEAIVWPGPCADMRVWTQWCVCVGMLV